MESTDSLSVRLNSRIHMSFAEQLKSQINIVDLIGQYVRLRRSGASNSYVGLCPFHSEKTPSFRVHGANQFYKCFGCDASGDIFKFVMEREGITFPEALSFLAERYGIAMPERQRFDDPEAQRRSALFEMHEIAAETFHRNLLASAGKEALRYLESRGVSRTAIEDFRLGFSDPSGHNLLQRLMKFGPSLLEESGLIAKRHDGSGFYDRFRGRLMFPIHNESGKIIGFGGRALRANDEPKYLNSPETKIYKKSTVLYNLHRAKIDARKLDRMILVEGYLDAIAIHFAGLHEVVATCGTALAAEQVRSIKRQVSQQGSTGEVILNFDSDAAGARSTEKYIATLLSEGLRVRIVELSGDLDPDEFIQQNGSEAYRNRVNTAVSYFAWLTARAREKFNMTTAAGRVDAFKSLLPAIQQVTDRMERAAISSEIAEALRVDPDIVRDVLRRAPATQPRPAAAAIPVIPASEKLLLACCLINSDARALTRSLLSRSEILAILELKAIFEAVLEIDRGGDLLPVETLMTRLEPPLRNVVADVSFSELGIREDQAGIQALDCARALEAKAESAARQRLKDQIRGFEQQGNFSEAIRLAEELNRLNFAPSAGENRVVL